MRQDVQNHVQKCLVCAKHKPPHQYVKAPLMPIPPPDLPWKTVAVDMKGPLPQTERGNRYIISFVCYLTKYIEAIAVPDIKTETVAQALMVCIVLRHGTPLRLISDRGTNLTAPLLSRICQLCNTEKVFTTPYHPEGDGLIERWHRSLSTYLNIYTKGQRDWDLYLPYAVYSHNTSLNSSIKTSPFQLLYGRVPRNPSDRAYHYVPNPYRVDIEDYADRVQRYLQASQRLAAQNIELAQQRQATQYNRSANIPTYFPGDRIFIRNPRHGPGGKLTQPPWLGPAVVEDVRGPNVLVKSPTQPTQEAQWQHVNRTKPCPKGAMGADNDQKDKSTRDPNTARASGTSTPSGRRRGVRRPTASTHHYNLRSSTKSAKDPTSIAGVQTKN